MDTVPGIVTDEELIKFANRLSQLLNMKDKSDREWWLFDLMFGDVTSLLKVRGVVVTDHVLIPDHLVVAA